MSYCVYPACAGIDLQILQGDVKEGCLPRMRGDRPIVASDSGPWIKFTPHARGSTFFLVLLPECLRFTRMRGSTRGLSGYGSGLFTPHARGSTIAVVGGRTYPFTTCGDRPFDTIFSAVSCLPACAGIDRSSLKQ